MANAISVMFSPKKQTVMAVITIGDAVITLPLSASDVIWLASEVEEVLPEARRILAEEGPPQPVDSLLDKDSVYTDIMHLLTFK